MKDSMFKLIAIAYWLALVFWIAAVITVGIAAMNTFGTLAPRDAPSGLGVRLDAYADYPGEHHGRLAAGIVMERNFFLADVIQMFSIPVVIVTLLVQVAFFGMSLKRPANVIRVFCLCVAAFLFSWYALKLAPNMNHELRAYWQAARAGQIDAAEQHRRAFDVKHPQAERILQLNLMLALAGAAASAVAFVTPSPKLRKTTIQVPRLARNP